MTQMIYLICEAYGELTECAFTTRAEAEEWIVLHEAPISGWHIEEIMLYGRAK